MDPAAPSTVFELLQLCDQIGRAPFCLANPAPFLVAVNWRATAWGTGAPEDSTVAANAPTPTAAPLLLDAPVWLVAKRTANQLPLLSIGRSSRNDVVVPEPSVSKLHASLTESGGGWILTDLGSSNGTFVAGVALEPLSPYPIPLGATLRLGHTATFRFLDADGLWEALDALRRAG